MILAANAAPVGSSRFEDVHLTVVRDRNHTRRFGRGCAGSVSRQGDDQSNHWFCQRAGGSHQSEGRSLLSRAGRDFCIPQGTDVTARYRMGECGLRCLLHALGGDLAGAWKRVHVGCVGGGSSIARLRPHGFAAAPRGLSAFAGSGHRT